MKTIELIKLIGGIAGLFAFIWKVLEELVGYLRIKIEVNNSNKTILSEVENIGKIQSKRISNAFLIINLEHEKLIDVGNIIANEMGLNLHFSCTNDFESLKGTKLIYKNENIAYLPLPFFFSENIGIGDEKLSYRSSVDTSKLSKGTYSVRLFIFGNKNRYHRTTHDLLVIN